MCRAASGLRRTLIGSVRVGKGRGRGNPMQGRADGVSSRVGCVVGDEMGMA